VAFKFQGRPSDLRLFLAKKSEGINTEWLDWAGMASLKLNEDGQPEAFTEEMDLELGMKDAKHFGAEYQPGLDQVIAGVEEHVPCKQGPSAVTVPMEAPSGRLAGPQVNLTSCEKIRVFLVAEMSDRSRVLLNPLVLDAANL
jgi:hypothetical protein